jgi:hypothetical protein
MKLTEENYREELMKETPFEKDDFYNSLSKQTITNKNYKTYLENASNIKNQLEYLKHYNILDTVIMIPIIKGLSKRFKDGKVDMLKNLSLSSTSSQVKYASAYHDYAWSNFDINEDYSEEIANTFKLTPEYWADMVARYKDQDKKAKRPIKDNVNEKDYDEFKIILETSVCHMCKEGFSDLNKPTLDRLNNNKPHVKNNVKPCCLYCNCFKSNRDENHMKLIIQLTKYARKYNLPFTLCKGQEGLYRLLRKGITGGLSNVHNRENIRGKTE